MVASERYERDVRRALRGQEEATEDELLARIGPIFLSYLGDVPAPLREEILAWYVDLYGRGDPRLPSVAAFALRISAVIDVFEQAYDAERAPLDEDEWEILRTLVNEHSPEMELPVLQYIMQILMDRGDIR